MNAPVTGGDVSRTNAGRPRLRIDLGPRRLMIVRRILTASLRRPRQRPAGHRPDSKMR